MTSSPAAVEVLARRADLLAAVREQSRSKPALVDELAVSRSTVDRAVRELEAEGFVARSDGVSLTLQGRLALDSYETFAAHLRDLDTAETALATLPDGARVERALLRDATVVEATPVAPQRATEAYRSLVDGASRVEGYASALLDGNVQTFRDRIVEDNLEADLVLSPDVLDALVGSHGDAVADALDTGRLTLREASRRLSYSLMLVETAATTQVCALFYDDSGHTGLIRNDAPEAVAWAEDVYEDLRGAADPLPE
jgi:predicted transcriptional regulator